MRAIRTFVRRGAGPRPVGKGGTEFPTKEEQMRGKSHDVASRSRMGPIATALMLALLLCMQGLDGAEAKTRKQCEADAKACRKPCNNSGWPTSCNRTCDIIWKQCECDGGRKSFCDDGPDDSNSLSPPTAPITSRRVHNRARQLSNPNPAAPVKPQGPGSVGTPPKSNPSTPVKPQGPGSVGSPPKSNSSSGGGGGTILRSGNSGNSNSSNSGSGNSGGSKR